MNILFLSHYFPPEVNAPATRTFEHCRHWAAQGNQVTVITCAPNHPKGKVFPGYRNQLYSQEIIEGIRVIRVWTYITANEGIVKRTLSYISFMLAAIIASLCLGKQDVVISTSPQFFNGLAGYFVSRLKRVKWILEIRDLWPESILAVGAIKNPKIIAALEAIEAFCYRKADHIISVTQSFKQHIQARGASASAISVVYNGVDLNLFEQNTALAKADIAASLGIVYEPSLFFAAYVGTHGMAHKLETILEAAELLRDHPEIRFLMAGDGSERQRLLQQKNSRGLNNVIMLEQLPKAAMPALWQLVDASLVLLKKSDLFKTVIPSKIFESMAMAKPIVLGVQGEVAGIIQEAQSGICIEPENAKQLAQAVLTLQQDAEGIYGQRGLAFVSRAFNRINLAQQFLDIIERVVHTRPGSALPVPFSANLPTEAQP